MEPTWKINLIEQNNPSGLILVSDYFDGWLPACAGMTVFFVMYGDIFFDIFNSKNYCGMTAVSVSC